jgi:hypothetical protein
LETGCYYFTIRGNTIINSGTEPIYMGHFSYLSPTITGVVIENNTIVDGGLNGEGDIDIKGGVSGAVVRYNVSYGTGTGHVLAGVVVHAPSCQIYGNSFYNLNDKPGDGDQAGITVNADGDGLGNGITVSDVLVYNNLIYGNEFTGISIYATASGATVSNLKILNNTIVGNGTLGIKASASGGRTITISELHNNILANNGTSALSTTSNASISAANNNLMYQAAGTLITYLGTNRNWGQWQGLGFDANGVNADPSLNGSYVPQGGSPAIGAGSTQTEFTIDKNQATRTAPWDIGCFETS